MMLFYFLSAASEPETAEAAEQSEHHLPLVAEQFYHLTHLTPEQLPLNILMMGIAAVVCVLGLKLLIGKPSVDKPSAGQQIIEVVVLQIRSMVEQAIGPYGFKYLTFLLPLAFFILISNLMGLIPVLSPPTASLNTTVALGLCSFVYYVSMGFRQQGIGYLKHFTGGLTSGPLILIGVLIFVVEIFSNCLRPLTLGFRLMINLYADEQVAEVFAGLSKFIVPSVLMVLATFVAFVQTFIFTQLSIVYLSETVPHDDHEEGHGDEHGHGDHKEVAHAH